jgi:dolichol kinase
LITAFAVMVTEALPLKDYDNIAIPLIAGAALSGSMVFSHFFI